MALWMGILAFSSAAEEKPAPLKVLVVARNKERGDGFEALIKGDGMVAGRLDWADLSKEKVRDFDVVLLDPEAGKTNQYGQSERGFKPVSEDLGKPVLAVGAPGSYALIALNLQFGNNG